MPIMNQGFPDFPTVRTIPYAHRPAKMSWSATAGEVIEADLPCGRDLTNIDFAILYVFTNPAGGSPKAIECAISNASAGVVRVEYNTSSTPVGEWRWTLFLMAPTQPIPAYTGTVEIKEPQQ